MSDVGVVGVISVVVVVTVADYESIGGRKE